MHDVGAAALDTVVEVTHPNDRVVMHERFVGRVVLIARGTFSLALRLPGGLFPERSGLTQGRLSGELTEVVHVLRLLHA